MGDVRGEIAEPDGVNYIAQVSPARFARGTRYVVTQRAGPPCATLLPPDARARHKIVIGLLSLPGITVYSGVNRVAPV